MQSCSWAICDKPFKKKAVYFDGCDIGRHSGVFDEPRKVLSAIPELELLEMPVNREDAACCGGPLLGSYPDYARAIAAKRGPSADERLNISSLSPPIPISRSPNQNIDR